MPTKAPTYKYNPAFLTQEELLRAFVVRHTDLDLIVQVVRDNAGPSNQHVLVVGPRGIGKSMLVLRVAAEVNRDEDLCKGWYPLVFAEESYQVHTPGEFWLEALFHLYRQTHDERWKRAHAELHSESDEERLRERALSQLMDFAERQGKRILLIAENLHMLLGEQLRPDDGWTLRHTLSNEPRVMLLATATGRFAEVENSDKAMFDLFRVHELRPLDSADCKVMWATITGQEPDDHRVRPVQILTGGNPRLLRIISGFAAQLSFRELMTELTELVDEHTEYFKSHLDNLAAVERKAYLALAELWDPATAREVAQAARLDVNKTSALLARLTRRGAVCVSDQQGRTKRYQLAERMYNIYYLMRRRGGPPRRVKALVNFMVSFYGSEQPLAVVRSLGEEALEHANRYLQDATAVKRTVNDAIGLLVDLAATGCGREALEILCRSPSAAVLKPLVVGLGISLGDEVKAATEIMEVGQDVAERIRKRQRELEEPRPAEDAGPRE